MSNPTEQSILLPGDLWNVIAHSLSLQDQSSLRVTNKAMMDSLKVYNIFKKKIHAQIKDIAGSLQRNGLNFRALIEYDDQGELVSLINTLTPCNKINRAIFQISEPPAPANPG